MKTRRVTPNWNRTDGSEFIGKKAVYRTYDRQKMVGTIEQRADSGRFIIRFDDGRWAYSDFSLELVV